MKKILAIFALVGLLSAAMPAKAEPVFGFIYKDATEAGVGFSNFAGTKVGTAKCTSYFGVVGLGDCSVTAAAKEGKIKNVAYYDVHTKNIVGFKRVTVNVYGQ